MTIRVGIVDDQELMRTALRTILEASGIEVVGEADDGDAAVALVRRTSPDVVLMDVRMPGRDGIDATGEIAAEMPGTKVLVLTTFDDDEYLYGALAAGAAGFLLKNSSPEDLVRAVERMVGGDAVLDPAVTARVFARFAGSPRRGSGPVGVDLLTEREKDVLVLLTRGQTNAEMAAELGVGEATVKTHVSRVISKLGVRDRTQAVIRAFETGFVESDHPLG